MISDRRENAADQLETVGPYRILSELGRGGMATVYLARRDGTLEDGNLEELAEGELVAVKVAHRGLPPRIHRRLRTEYRILSRLQHPHIASVLEAGLTADGRPYFVMEYLRGVPIDAYCDEHSLPVAARLKLLIKVCEAVEVAHQQGVVHRDIKPSNVLVNDTGVPWLLDFGIAKLLDPDDQTFTVPDTRTSERLLTPSYASPEQIYGEEITPRSDVYSIGALLYRLLTGTVPLDFEHYSAGAMRRVFQHQKPVTPSEKKHQTSGVEGGLTWTEDLDWIVMKAISYEASERYATVVELTTDLLGYLEGEEPAGSGYHQAISGGGFNRLRRVMAGVGFSLLVAVAIAIAWCNSAWSGSSPLPLKKRESLAVGEIRNLVEGEISDDVLTAAFSLGFEISAYFNVYTNRHLRSVLRRGQRNFSTPVDREIGVEISRHEGIDALVLGAVASVDGKFRVSIEIIDPRSGSRGYEGWTEGISLLPTLGQAISDARLALGEPESMLAASAELEKVTTSNRAALRSYVLATSRSMDLSPEETSRLLQRAVSLEPGFALAQARLAAVYQRHSPSEAMRHLAQAIEFPDRLTDYERARGQAQAARWSGTWGEALAAAFRLTRRFSQDHDAHTQLGDLFYSYSNNYEAAATSFEDAYETASSFIALESALSLLTRTYIALEDRDRLARTIRNFPQANQSERRLRAYFLTALLERNLRQAEALADEARLLKTDADPSSPFPRILLAADQGYLGQTLMAETTLDPALKWVLEGSIRSSPGDLVDLHAALRFVAMPSGGRDESLTWIVLVKNLARQGALDEARRLSERFAPRPGDGNWPIWRAYRKLLNGEILLAAGRPGEALESFLESQRLLDTFQIHESLAEVYEVLGRPAEAVAERQWLVDHRGRALVEGDQGDRGPSVLAVRNIIDWNLAFFRRARLLERLGDLESAKVSYERFLELREGDDLLWLKKQARRRLDSADFSGLPVD